MNIYTPEEIERINKITETNEKLQDFFLEKRKGWSDSIIPLFEVLKIYSSERPNPEKILDAQSQALSFRQNITDEINLYLNKRSRETSKVKKIKQDKFIFYATGFGVKTNLGEKSILIDAHLRENERTLEIIESYVEFLRDTAKNLESLGYSIKNMIELLNYLSR
jgi:hypothetical protein